MFGIQLIWNMIPFAPIPGPNTFLPIQRFQTSSAVKLEADDESGETKVTGRELQTASFSIRVQSVAGADPRLTFELLSALRGQSSGIYIANGLSSTLAIAALDALQTSDWRKLLSVGTVEDIAKGLLMGNKIGGVSFMLTAVSMDVRGVTGAGHIYDAEITLSFTEDAAQRQTGGLVVYFNDKDITSSIAVSSCVYDQHAEGEADSLQIIFADTKKEWEKWKPNPQGDFVRITDGALDSGKMYLDTLKPESGKFKLQAYSTPKTAFSTKSRSFKDANLQQIARKIASEHNLTAKAYGVPEVKMKYIQQKGQNDLAFLHSICKQHGVSFIIYNGDICLYSQKYIEGMDAVRTITPASTDHYEVKDDKQAAVATVELRNGTFTGRATDASIKTGKVHRETVKAAWANESDANAAAKAKLRELNKGSKTAMLTMSTQRGLAAGSVINLLCTGWAGKAMIYRIRHNLQKKTSDIWVRDILSY